MKKNCFYCLLLLALALSFVLQTVHAAFAESLGSWTETGAMSIDRRAHTETLLKNGKILIAGGFSDSRNSALSSAELYDPSTGKFTTTGAMSVARYEHTATVLPDGKVLITGGYFDLPPTQFHYNTASAELYDPDKGSFMRIADMNYGRAEHTATLLNNGKVIIAGGFFIPPGLNFEEGRRAELYDPETRTFTLTSGSMQRMFPMSHTATLLTNGSVLITGGLYLYVEPVIGGTVAWFSSNKSEIYNPDSDSFNEVPLPMTQKRSGHTAILLPDGRVLIVGGADATYDYLTSSPNGISLLSDAEFYDPVNSHFDIAGSMSTSRWSHTATLLSNKYVLIVGGVFSPYGQINASAELYDLRTETFVPAGSMSLVRSGHTATLLPHGKVLIAGGSYELPPANVEELYQYCQTGGTFIPTDSMLTDRIYHSAAELQGTVLVTGEFLIKGDLL